MSPMIEEEKKLTFCIILPVFNEKTGINDCVQNIYSFLEKNKSIASIIIVNDGSTDGTETVLNDLINRFDNVIVEVHDINKGYGEACRTGFKATLREGFDYALVMDADSTQDPKFISGFMEEMNDSTDFIKATRYSKSGRVEGVHWKRRLISMVGNFLAKLILRTPISDYTNGFRAISAPLLSKMETYDSGFSVLIEEVREAKRLNATFSEVPYVLTVRSNEHGKSKFVYSWSVYKSYLQKIFGPVSTTNKNK
jgi:glycosyltransferase involved in cell wall biosynthesis